MDKRQINISIQRLEENECEIYLSHQLDKNQYET